MKKVRYYDTVFEADIECEILEENGIKAIVLNGNTSTVLPISFSNPSMRPYIVVPDGEYERACQLLEIDTRQQGI